MLTQTELFNSFVIGFVYGTIMLMETTERPVLTIGSCIIMIYVSFSSRICLENTEILQLVNL